MSDQTAEQGKAHNIIRGFYGRKHPPLQGLGKKANRHNEKREDSEDKVTLWNRQFDNPS